MANLKPVKTPPEKGKEKKARAPRKEYGFDPEATITLPKEKKAYRGKRQEWYEKLAKYENKKVSQFLESNQGKDSPRGWLRFFAQDGSVNLVAPK